MIMPDLKFGIGTIMSVAVSLFLFLFLSVSAAAEEIPSSVAPGTLGRPQEKEAPPKSKDQPVLPRPSEQEAPKSGAEYRFVLKKLKIEGNTVFKDSDFSHLYDAKVGKEIDISTLFTMANAITRMYADAGYALSAAYVPAQKIGADGEAGIRVVEGWIAEIAYTGDLKGLTPRIKRRIESLRQEKPLTTATLERRLLLADDTPGIEIRTTVDRSQKGIGATRLVVDLVQKKVGAEFGVNNRGTKALGPLRFDTALGLDGILLGGSSLNFRYQRAEAPDRYFYGALDYSLPVTDTGTRMEVSGYVSESRPDIEVLNTLDYFSSSRQVALEVSHPWIRSRPRNLDGKLRLDVKDARSELLDTENTNEKTRVIRLGLKFDWIDTNGAVSSIQTRVSRGLNILDATDNNSAVKSRAHTDFGFTSLLLSASRLQPLFTGISLMARIKGLYSGEALPVSEQLGWGGEPFGRAYDDFETAGDAGFLGSLELRKTFVNPFPTADYLQLYLFADAAGMWTHYREITGDDAYDSGTGMGLGIRGGWLKHHRFYVEWAIPRQEMVQQEQNKDPRLFFSWVIHY